MREGVFSNSEVNVLNELIVVRVERERAIGECEDICKGVPDINERCVYRGERVTVLIVAHKEVEADVPGLVEEAQKVDEDCDSTSVLQGEDGTVGIVDTVESGEEIGHILSSSSLSMLLSRLVVVNVRFFLIFN